jgi:hypothetical protein
MVRATCRSRRVTRWRSTAEPTGLATISPTRGPLQPRSQLRRTCTTTSACTVRIPYFTVASNSVDRLMRLRAGSTAKKPAAAIRQIRRGGLYGADWRRRSAPREYASAGGSRARGLGAGYSAGRSACPWPRHSPRCLWLKHSSHPPTTLPDCVHFRVVRRWVLQLAGAVPGVTIRVAAVSPTFGRLFEGTEQPSLGQTWSPAREPTQPSVKTCVLGKAPAARCCNEQQVRPK